MGYQYIEDPSNGRVLSIYSKKGIHVLKNYLNQSGGNGCSSYRKTKNPKCDDQDNCEWVIRKGCQDKKHPKKKHQVKKHHNKKHQSHDGSRKCSHYHKNKGKRCDDQPGCQWITSQGCLERGVNVHNQRKKLRKKREVEEDDNECIGLHCQGEDDEYEIDSNDKESIKEVSDDSDDSDWNKGDDGKWHMSPRTKHSFSSTESESESESDDDNSGSEWSRGDDGHWYRKEDNKESKEDKSNSVGEYIKKDGKWVKKEIAGGGSWYSYLFG